MTISDEFWQYLAGVALALVAINLLADIPSLAYDILCSQGYETLSSTRATNSPYGRFPVPDDPFQFLPCTNATWSPALDDPTPRRSWAVAQWSEMPRKRSEPRITRLAVNKFQVSGLARADLPIDSRVNPRPGSKSKRPIVIEPGGPGVSGTFYAWRAIENVTERLSDSQFDALG
ncbi:hypothetical protein F4824DRAFT_493795 [Ustulina deusta]|nr:hypothetical protein F4824DRAFT_493795 [Ustulina deusta]